MTHFSPHVDRRREIWEDVLRDSFRRAAVARDRFELREIAWRMFAAIGDAPALAHVDDDVRLGFRLPVRWAFIEGQVVVTAVDPGRAPDLRVGDVVEAIDGQPVGPTLAGILEYTPGLTDARRHVWALDVLTRGLTGSPRVLQVRHEDGTSAEIRASTVPVWPPLPASPASPTSEAIRDLDDGLLYIDLGRLKADELRAAAARIAAPRAAVLDLRSGVDRDVAALLGAVEAVRDVHRFWPEGQHAWTSPRSKPVGAQSLDVTPLSLPPRLAIVMDARVQEAESVIDVLRARPGVTLVGAATAVGVAPRRATLTLPGGMSIRVTETLAHRPGGHDPLAPIEPDIPVERTLAGVRAGRDELLEAAVAALRRAE